MCEWILRLVRFCDLCLKWSVSLVLWFIVLLSRMLEIDSDFCMRLEMLVIVFCLMVVIWCCWLLMWWVSRMKNGSRVSENSVRC